MSEAHSNMVSSMLLLKLLHCKGLTVKKQIKRDNKKAERQGPSRHSVSRAPRLETAVKVEYKYDQTLCRVCLKDGNIPIFGIEDLSADLNTIAGLDVSIDDAHPKNLCESCKDLLQNAVLFRKTAQQIDGILKQPMQVEPSPAPSINSDNYIDTEDEENLKEEPVFDSQVPKEKKTKKKLQKQETYQCRKCDLDFNTYEELQNHRLSVDHDKLRKNCPTCNKSVVAGYLKRHIYIMHNDSIDYKHICDVCGKKFSLLTQCKKHRVTHFLDELPIKCSLCPYRGRFRECLKLHMLMHTGEKPHQCPHCPSRFFRSRSNLNKHLCTHKTQPDFVCDQCQHGYYRKRDLEMHYKVVHIGIKDHICDQCGKAFGYRKQMMKHKLKVHKRDKLQSGRMPLYLQLEKKMQQEKES